MQLSLQKDFYTPDYESEKSKLPPSIPTFPFPLDECARFITTFQDASLKEDPIHGKIKYMIIMVIIVIALLIMFNSKKSQTKKAILLRLMWKISKSSSSK